MTPTASSKRSGNRLRIAMDQSLALDDDAARLEERKKMVVGLTNTAIDSLRKKSIHLIMTDKQKSSQTLTVALWSQKPVVSMIQKDPNFRIPSISLEEEEGSIAVVKSAVSFYKTIKSGIYDYVNPPSESSRMDPRSEPVEEWELAIGATPGAWQPGRMQLAPLTSDEWKSKLTQLTAQGTGVHSKERGGREKTVGEVKHLDDTSSN